MTKSRTCLLWAEWCNGGIRDGRGGGGVGGRGGVHMSLRHSTFGSQWLQSGVVVRDEPRQGFTGGSSEQGINLIPVSLEQLGGSGGRNNGYDINHIDLLNER
ncbi:hypothetical protein G4B88_015114 [Cannabis sativa]|uniref:Uncharacterized protein n=1 Tax=Cannabis sativa TaxID=3483 RepID=A0A7J6F336_CANSA|nr:hypothetical protein G4B88_015114 [Cannabis sativa]